MTSEKQPLMGFVDLVRIGSFGLSLVLLVAFPLGASQANRSLRVVQWDSNDKPKCGQSSISSFESSVGGINNKIYNGQIGKPGQLPFQAGVYVCVNGTRSRDPCGGVIIDEYTVLTVAHCVSENHPLDVYIGDYNRSQPDGEQVFRVERTHTHPDFNESTLRADLAILKTREKMSWMLTPDGFGSVNRICLPQEDAKYRAGEIVRASGWGAIDDNLEIMSDVLRLVDNEMIDTEQCQKLFPTNITLGPGQICTSQKGKRGISGGDSGGPVFRRLSGSEQAELIALPSYTCHPKHEMATIHTRISHYMNWIRDYMD